MDSLETSLDQLKRKTVSGAVLVAFSAEIYSASMTTLNPSFQKRSNTIQKGLFYCVVTAITRKVLDNFPTKLSGQKPKVPDVNRRIFHGGHSISEPSLQSFNWEVNPGFGSVIRRKLSGFGMKSFSPLVNPRRRGLRSD